MTKCCVKGCLMDATLMPRVKHGPVRQMAETSREQLGISTEEAEADESKRQKIMALAYQKAYSNHMAKACCPNCIPKVVDMLREEGEAGDIQMVPYGRRQRATVGRQVLNVH